jgi:hypothetical protein
MCVCLFFCVCESVDVGTLEKLATDQLVTTRWINSDGVMRKFFFYLLLQKMTIPAITIFSPCIVIVCIHFCTSVITKSLLLLGQLGS